MLRRLRIELTVIYMLAGILLMVILGAGLYWRLTNYFQTTTDLALKFRLAQELRLLSAPISPDLEKAERDWEDSLNSNFRIFKPLPTPQTLIEPILTPSQTMTSPGTEEELENNNGSSGGGGDHIIDQELNTILTVLHPTQIDFTNGISQQIISTPTPIIPLENVTSPVLDGELAIIFVIPLNSNGSIQPVTSAQKFPIQPDKAAMQAASITGEDIRTIKTNDGVSIRLLTYNLPAGYQVRFLQLGRPIDDQTRLLNQYLMGLIGISLIVLLLVGILSWWLAGNSLIPAQRSLEEQQAFIANASHELRTPLTLIRSSTEMASRSIPDGEPKQLLNDVMKDVDYMSRMVEDLLLMSRLDNKRLTINRKPVSINMLFADIQNQAQMISGGDIVHSKMLDQDVKVMADPDRLRQVLLILLDNAIQYTPKDGIIQLGAEISRKQVAIIFEDSGYGISADDLPHIFERFYQVAPHNETKNRGAGLGLSLAKSLIEMQHGHIQVQSQPGVGTRFTILLEQSQK
jgi:signal transduction histidine kinase